MQMHTCQRPEKLKVKVEHHLKFSIQLLEANSILCFPDIIQLMKEAGGPLIQQGRQIAVQPPERLHFT